MGEDVFHFSRAKRWALVGFGIFQPLMMIAVVFSAPPPGPPLVAAILMVTGNLIVGSALVFSAFRRKSQRARRLEAVGDSPTGTNSSH